jgi:hypothetical protein
MPHASIGVLKLVSRVALSNIRRIFLKHADTLREFEILSGFPYKNAEIFHPLRLHVFTIHVGSNRPSENLLIDIISHQPELRSLCIGQIESSECIYASDRLLSTICNLKDLKKLEMGIEKDVEMAQFLKLKELENVSIEFKDEAQGVEFCKINMPTLKSLNMANAVATSTFDDISKSFPNLEIFHVDIAQETTFNLILNGLPKLQELSFNSSHYKFDESNAVYPNMKKLELWCEGSPTIALSVAFIKAMPNLEEIHVEKLTGTSDVLESLLESKVQKIFIRMPFRNIRNIKKLKQLKNMLKQKLGSDYCEISLIP